MEDLSQLYEVQSRLLGHIRTSFVRSLDKEINWDSRLVSLKGARGTGKTTLFLQHIKNMSEPLRAKSLYASLDFIWFSRHSLYDLADSFYKSGGLYLFLDEVHKYPFWAQEIKNIYDSFPALHIAFTGSSLLEILNSRSDLSRRALSYTLNGLSFREFVNLRTCNEFSAVTLDDILTRHTQIANDIVANIKPLQFFDEYLRIGFYPYFIEGEQEYPLRLQETANMILEVELPMLRNVNTAFIPRLKQLLAIIAESVPFIPNITKIASLIGIGRETLMQYLAYFDEACLTRSLYKKSRGISALQKPDKLYLENTNLMYVLGGSNTNGGNVRETFAANQLSCTHTINYTDAGDFLVDGTYTVEVGGQNKTRSQIKDVADSYVAADGIESGHGSYIPLWLFGWMY